MPTKIWVVGEEVLAADWNSLVQEQVVATFSSAAARTAAIPAPKVGMHTYLADTGVTEVWTDKTSPASWRKPWGQPWGPLLVSETANSGIVTPTRVAATGIGAASFVGGRRVRFLLTVTGLASPSGANIAIRAEICAAGGAPVIASGWAYLFDAARYTSLVASRVTTPPAGTVNYEIWAQSAGGNVALGGPVTATIEDLGP